MKYITMIGMMAFGLMAHAQKEATLSDFNKLEIEIPFKIEVVPSSINKIVHPTSLNGLSFEVKNNTLNITVSGDGVPKFDGLQLYTTSLNEIELNGAGELNMPDGKTLKADKFNIEINGAGKVNLNLDVKELNARSSGASRITLRGNASKANIELSGASKLFASNFQTDDLELESNGACTFQVNVKNNLSIEANGASKGEYSGNPQNKKINITGLSRIVDATTGENMNDERVGADDTTRITIGKKKLIIIEEAENEKKEKGKSDKNQDGSATREKKYELKSVYSGFELGMNNFTDPNLSFSLPASVNFLECNMGQSWFYGINPLEGDLQIITNKLALTSGLGLEFQNFNFTSDKILQPNVKAISSDSGLVALSKNKLYNFNVSVPLLVKFAPRTRKHKNNFHLAAGVIGTYKAYSHLKTESTAFGYEQENITRDDFNINPFRVAATVRIGYGWFRAFANYSLTPYFKTTGSNPDVRVFTAGLTIIPFN